MSKICLAAKILSFFGAPSVVRFGLPGAESRATLTYE
jgi:hypothetical protein